MFIYAVWVVLSNCIVEELSSPIFNSDIFILIPKPFVRLSFDNETATPTSSSATLKSKAKSLTLKMMPADEDFMGCSMSLFA